MLDAPYFLSQYNSLKATALKNRYITNSHIEPLLTSLSNQFSQSLLGTSEAGLSNSWPSNWYWFETNFDMVANAR